MKIFQTKKKKQTRIIFNIHTEKRKEKRNIKNKKKKKNEMSSQYFVPFDIMENIINVINKCICTFRKRLWYQIEYTRSH